MSNCSHFNEMPQPMILAGSTGRSRPPLRLLIAAVGHTTAAALEKEGVTPQVIPDRPGGVELVEALVAYASKP